ncbi:hypothetical protein B0T20DRAFT_244399 [Sordaria brevicollis]|uniref:Uncharacterized protein n=1 Tax=Sordaria brevicollis TaxID=83679 RepID=A0AAE0PBJ6_SORBR|nr:hypothetical protein B0T20DRAFT_244399 [Sordaria brevicollis]
MEIKREFRHDYVGRLCVVFQFPSHHSVSIKPGKKQTLVSFPLILLPPSSSPHKRCPGDRLHRKCVWRIARLSSVPLPLLMLTSINVHRPTALKATPCNAMPGSAPAGLGSLAGLSFSSETKHLGFGFLESRGSTWRCITVVLCSIQRSNGRCRNRTGKRCQGTACSVFHANLGETVSSSCNKKQKVTRAINRRVGGRFRVTIQWLASIHHLPTNANASARTLGRRRQHLERYGVTGNLRSFCAPENKHTGILPCYVRQLFLVIPHQQHSTPQNGRRLSLPSPASASAGIMGRMIQSNTE